MTNADHDSADANQRSEPVICEVATMKLSDGRKDHYVSITCGKRNLTPHVFSIKGRAEYEAAEWNWLLNGGEKPFVLDYDTDGPSQGGRLEPSVRSLEDASRDLAEQAFHCILGHSSGKVDLGRAMEILADRVHEVKALLADRGAERTETA